MRVLSQALKVENIGSATAACEGPVVDGFFGANVLRTLAEADRALIRKAGVV
jgi:hypothetical protein